MLKSSISFICWMLTGPKEINDERKKSFDISVTNICQVVYELEPKKIGIWLWQVDQTYYRFLGTSWCLLPRKV